MSDFQNRFDFQQIVNSARFFLRHCARGFYPIIRPCWSAPPVNRMFFPLHGPADAGFVRDAAVSYELRPGYWYFIPACRPADFHLDEKLYFLSLQTNLEIFPGTELFSSCSRILELPAPDELAELTALFDAAGEGVPFDALRCGSLAFALLTSLFRYYDAADFAGPLRLRPYRELTEFLRASADARTTVGELAALRGESREGFTRRFTARTGVTPKQLIDRFVTGKAMDLLAAELSVKEIAAQLNFSSEYAFSRFFKRCLAVSPRTWRQRRSAGL